MSVELMISKIKDAIDSGKRVELECVDVNGFIADDCQVESYIKETTIKDKMMACRYNSHGVYVAGCFVDIDGIESSNISEEEKIARINNVCYLISYKDLCFFKIK